MANDADVERREAHEAVRSLRPAEKAAISRTLERALDQRDEARAQVERLRSALSDLYDHGLNEFADGERVRRAAKRLIDEWASQEDETP